MKVRILSILAAGVMVLGVAGLMAPAASANRSPHLAHHGMAKAVPRSIARVLYDQNDNDAGVPIPSQNFEEAFNNYDSQAADDFTVPSGQTWKIRNVTVTGRFYSGYGPTDAGALGTLHGSASRLRHRDRHGTPRTGS